MYFQWVIKKKGAKNVESLRFPVSFLTPFDCVMLLV